MKNKEKYDLRYVDYDIMVRHDRSERKTIYLIQIYVGIKKTVAFKHMLYKVDERFMSDKLVETIAWNCFREWLEIEVQDE